MNPIPIGACPDATEVCATECRSITPSVFSRWRRTLTRSKSWPSLSPRLHLPRGFAAPFLSLLCSLPFSSQNTVQVSTDPHPGRAVLLHHDVLVLRSESASLTRPQESSSWLPSSPVSLVRLSPPPHLISISSAFVLLWQSRE
jgi:hypothetical protein